VADVTSAAGGNGGSAGAGGGGRGGRDAGRPDARDSGAGARDAASDYIDDLDCGPPTSNPPEQDCDPFAASSGCSRGEACYPFVDYPTGPCDREEYGTRCAPAGSGRQGDACEQGRCAQGFVCVVTGQGNQCIELCRIERAGVCPAGLVCLPIDVEGFGGCF
jgi:hypothetical protein